MMIISLEVEKKKKKKKKKTLKKIEFQNETVKYKIVFVIERNS